MSTGNPFNNNQAYTANYYEQQRAAASLPVSQRVPHLLATLQNNNVMVFVGETGSGKTTQLPKAMLLADAEMNLLKGKKIALTQNRQLAAKLVAERIAEEMDVELGGVVGLKHRGRDSTSAATRLEVVTDGTLMAMAKGDPSLSAYGAIIIDEAHEHTISTDLLLGLLKKLAERRKNDLKIIVMSATINAALFTDFFPGSVLETVRGRTYPVTMSYLTKAPSDMIEAIIETVLRVHRDEQCGDILVFASGTREIFKIIAGVKEELKKGRYGPLSCWPLHAQLPQEEQDAAVRAVAPVGQGRRFGRKVIVATNIAETSITLVGVTHVIDSCLVKSKVWNSSNESWSLQEHWISKSVAAQRAGRAGRTSPGMAWRMCTETGFNKLVEQHSVPAMLETDMNSECLTVLKLGYSPFEFPYLTPPASHTVGDALNILRELGALNLKSELTPRGSAIMTLPVDVYSATVLLNSPEFGCSDEIISLISLIEASEGGSSLFMSPSSQEAREKLDDIRDSFRHPSGDHLTLFNVYMAWRQAQKNGTSDEFLTSNMLHGRVLKAADATRQQLLAILTKTPGWTGRALRSADPDYYVKMVSALASGNFLRVAKLVPQSKPAIYQVARSGMYAKLLPWTKLGPACRGNEWVFYHEFNSKRGKEVLHLVTAITAENLVAAAPGYWSRVEVLPAGNMRNEMTKVLAKMSGRPFPTCELRV